MYQLDGNIAMIIDIRQIQTFLIHTTCVLLIPCKGSVANLKYDLHLQAVVNSCVVELSLSIFDSNYISCYFSPTA